MIAEQPRRPELHFRIFAFLWASTTLFHVGKWNLWLHNPGDFLLFLCACAVLLDSSSVRRLALLAVVQIGVMLLELPLVSNHTWFMTIVNLTLLAAMGAAAVRGGRKHVRSGDVYAIAAPVIRVELVLIYTIAAFHKLNADWFDPEMSCAVVLHDRIASWLPWLDNPPLTHWTSIFLGVGIEIALPILLIFRRTRPVAILLGGIFHLVLGMIRFYRFSSQMYVLYFLFVPEEYIDRAQKIWKRLRRTRLRALLEHPLSSPENIRRVGAALLVVLCLAVLIVGPWRATSTMDILVRDLGPGVRQPLLSQAFQILWLLWSIVLLVVFIGLLAGSHGTTRRDSRRTVSVPAWLSVFPLLVVINGASPYLGLKTESSFAMFSNLRTSTPGNNHLLVKRTLHLTPFPEDLVWIRASSDPQLRELAAKGYGLPWFELTSYIEYRLDQGEDFSVTFERGGVRRHVASVHQAREQFAPPPWILRKLLHFRPVYGGERCPCTH